MWSLQPSPLSSLSLVVVFKHIHIHIESLIYLPPFIKEKLLRKFLTKYDKYRHVFSVDVAHDIVSKLVHKNIKQLDLSLIFMDDDMLNIFSQCRELTELKLHNHCYVHEISSEAFKRFFEKTPKLLALDVCFCQGFDDSVLECIAVNCPNLSNLSCAFCHITDGGLKVLAHNNKKIKCLTVSHTQVTGEGIIDAVVNKNWQYLQELRIDENEKVNNHVLEVVIENCPKMEILTFHNCGSATGSEIANIVMNTIRKSLRPLRSLKFKVSKLFCHVCTTLQTG